MKFYNSQNKITFERLKGSWWCITDKLGRSEPLEFLLDSESEEFVSFMIRFRICKNRNIDLWYHGQWYELQKTE